MRYSLNALYRVVGISKQAVSQYGYRQTLLDKKVQQLILEADELRRAHPGCGVEKMYYTLKPDCMGRDRFIEIFMALGYRLKKAGNYRITTRRGDFYYPNLIEGLTIDGPSQVWQSDITYIRVKDQFYYAVFIIDVYTKKIVGYSLSDHMRASANVHALRKALKRHVAPMYHHSDRGSQYIYKVYTGLLKDKGVAISMGEIAQENAYAERVNGTIKNEFLEYWSPQSFNQLKRQVKKAVEYYNWKRPHNHIGRRAPGEYHREFSLGASPQRKSLTIFKFENDSLTKTVNSI